ncbi:membrane dipeptidase [Granulicella aggregans]|uniref:Membrane dipeptidase n=1 Tax=Granulicella aggregans TaxID=474949 RepID=A0A7W8E3L5_9BACT|nr:dipeptidase [Granulicella aggregans]MBB5057601.1 membrane dipeptidase [Granulicella aggregans]
MDKIAIFDGHNDAVHLIREYKPDGIDFLAANATGHLDLPRARTGGMIGGFFALWVPAEHPLENTLTTTESSYSVRMAEPLDPAYARRETARQLAALKSLEARSEGSIRIATTVTQLEQSHRDGVFSMLLHIEGAEAIGPDLTELDALYTQGLRSLGPVWSRPNLFGHGVPFAFPSSPDTGPGLTSAGFDLIHAFNRLGIMIDLSHLNERGFWDVARTSTAPLVATHTCAHALCPSARNLTDRQLDAIRESNGIVGVNFSVNDLRPDANRNADVSLDNVVRQFTYLTDRIGIDRVALGSDFDGATIPSAIGDASGLQNLIAALRTHGFDEASLNKIARENWMRVLRLTLR